MATTTLTSELEAINTILQAGGEAPVASLTITGLLPLTRAKDLLNETSRLVQGSGWTFNTEQDYELVRDVNGNITLPADALKFDPEDYYNSRFRPVARGLRLYNGKDFNYVFSENIKGVLVRLLPWDDMPQAVRHYVMIRAAMIFQQREEGSAEGARFTEADEVAARRALAEYENAVEDANVLTDSWSCWSILGNRGEGIW